MTSACRVQTSGVAIVRYVWIRENAIGWDEDVGSVLRSSGGGLLHAVGDPGRVPSEHPEKLVLRVARETGDPQVEEQRLRLHAVRVVRGVEELLRRDARVEIEHVHGSPDRGVEVDAGVAGERVRECCEIGDAAVRDDERRPRMAVDDPMQVVGNRRQPSPAVDEDRHAPLSRQREDRRESLVVQEELLSPRVQLDPPGAEIEAAGRLRDRLLRQVEPHEGDQHPV